MAHKILQAITITVLAYGLWAHDVRLIIASIGLSAMWLLIHEEVREQAR